MKTKKLSRNLRLFRNFVGNDFRWTATLIKYSRFHTRLIALSYRYFPPESKDEHLGRFGRHLDTKLRFGKRKEIKKLSSNIVDTMPSEKRFIFYRQIHKLMKDYPIDPEWLSTIVDYIVLGVSIPPEFKLSIATKPILPSKEELASKKKIPWPPNARVRLTLHPDTTLEDIEDAWETISKLKKESWTQYKPFRFSPKKITQYARIWEFDESKRRLSDEDKYEGLNDGMEKIWAKSPDYKNDPAKLKKIIRNYRKQNGKRIINIKIKKQYSDLEALKNSGSHLPAAKTKKAAATIRQQRRRIKNVTLF